MRVIVKLDPFLINTHKANLAKAYQYAKAMESGACFPPVWVYKTNKPGVPYKCKNGAHRIHAARMLNREISAMIWKDSK